MDKVKRIAKKVGYWSAATVLGTVGFFAADVALHSEKKYGQYLSGVLYAASAFAYVRLGDRMVNC